MTLSSSKFNSIFKILRGNITDVEWSCLDKDDNLKIRVQSQKSESVRAT